jgi:hypothetical protein
VSMTVGEWDALGTEGGQVGQPERQPVTREPFYIIEEQYRESMRRTLEPLSDDDLEDVYRLFSVDNLPSVPLRYHNVTWKIRAAVRHEQKRRAKEPTPSE